jgi:hypothetical protein
MTDYRFNASPLSKLAASAGVEVQGLSDEFYYDSEAGDGSDAW